MRASSFRVGGAIATVCYDGCTPLVPNFRHYPTEKHPGGSEWLRFQVDFGGSEAGVLEHLRKHAEGTLAEALRGFQGKVSYEYDWSLNE